MDLAYFGFAGDPIISGTGLHIISTYVTDYKAVTTNMPVKAVPWSVPFSAKDKKVFKDVFTQARKTVSKRLDQKK